MSEWIKAAKVGDKVVCLSVFEGWARRPLFTLPIVGGVYTIREIVVGWYEAEPETVHLRFTEISNAPQSWVGGDISEPAFLQRRFKPVAPQQKSIEALRALTDKPFADLPERERVLEMWC